MTEEPDPPEVFATLDDEYEQASVDGEADVTALVEAVEDAGYTAQA